MASAPILVTCVLLVACRPGSAPAPAPGKPEPPRGPSLYDRLGRMDVIGDIVADLVEVELPQSALAPRFANVDRAGLEDGLARRLCELAGGPCRYPERALRELHAQMAIEEREFEAFVAALERSLVRLQIAPDVRADVLTMVRGEHDSIVVPP